jgi:predicted lipid carrier protein YhbT
MITRPPVLKHLPLPPLPTISAFRLPQVISRLGGRLPQWPHGALLSLLLNGATSLGLLPDDTLRELDGKHFRITVSDLGSVADFRYLAGRFEPCLIPVDSPDLSFSAETSAYLQMITRQEDPDTLFFNRRLRIEGDTELGLRVKNMLDALDIGSASPRR